MFGLLMMFGMMVLPILLIGFLIIGGLGLFQRVNNSAPIQVISPAPAAIAKPDRTAYGKYCAHCGAGLQPDWTHCPQCGAPIS